MKVAARDHVASANCGFLLDIFFSSFVNAFDFKDSRLTDFCFFKSETSDWNDRKGQNETMQCKASYVEC
jgi:hypothetical protein